MTQKEMILYGLYVERIHRLAVDIAIQSAGFGEYGMGIAVVADECRDLGIRLYREFENTEVLHNATAIAFLEELNLLTLNGTIEALRLDGKEQSRKTTKPLAVIFDEIRMASGELCRFLGGRVSESLMVTPVSPQNRVLSGRFPYLAMTLGGKIFYENVECIIEVIKDVAEEDGMLLYRQNASPVLSAAPLQKKETIPVCYVLLNQSVGHDPSKCMALPLDAYPSIIWNGVGTDTALPEEAAAYTRVCWNCEENQQMLFLDYEKLR